MRKQPLGRLGNSNGAQRTGQETRAAHGEACRSEGKDLCRVCLIGEAGLLPHAAEITAVCSPYLARALILAAGLKGIEDHCDLPPPATGRILRWERDHSMWGTMEFAVLGTLMAKDGDVDRTPSAPKLRRVLATLLFRSNKLVLAEALAEELWQNDPPPTAMATLQTYVYQLRKALGSDGRDRDGMIRTQTDPSGYVLTVNPEQLDLARFRSLLREGRRALEEHRPDRASEVLHNALSLWQGPALGGLCTGPVLEADAVYLEEERMNALELRIDADLCMGGHRQLISELKSLTAAHPLHEWFQSRLMIALYLSSRRGEALETFHRHRHILRDELGLDPHPEIQRLQQEILNSEPTSWQGADRVYPSPLIGHSVH